MINFTDDDLAKISLDYINYPVTRAGLVLTLADSQQTVQENLEADAPNKEFTDFYRSLVGVYSSELNLLNQSGFTEPPNESALEIGAQRQPPFFPTSWLNLPPLLQASNNGSPAIPYSGVNEPDEITTVKTQIDTIKNGITGSGSSQVETEYVVGATVLRADDVTVFSAGDFIFAINGGDALFAQIDSIVKDPDCMGSPNEDETDATSCTNNGGTWSPTTAGDLNITVLQAPLANLPVGTTIESSIAGFTNEEREESVSLTPERDAQLQILKDLVDASVQANEDFYTGTYLPLLGTNGDLKNKTDIDNNVSSINTLVGAIDTWQSFPSTNPTGTGTESRFGDIELDKLELALTTREGELPTRVSQINTALGSVTQDTVGDVSGTGIFFDFGDWQAKRIASGTGSLAIYFASLIGVEVAQRVLDDLDSSQAERDIYFVIEALIMDATGTDTILVGDTTGLALTDELKVFAEGQPTLTGNIIGLTATAIQLDITVSVDYTIANVARVLKQNS